MANTEWKTDEYWKTVSTVVVLVFAGLATLAYALRMYAVRISSGKFKIEDYLMGIGLLLSYGATVATVVSTFGMPSSKPWRIRRDVLTDMVIKMPSMESAFRPTSFLPLRRIGLTLSVSLRQSCIRRLLLYTSILTGLLSRAPGSSRSSGPLPWRSSRYPSSSS